LGDVLTRLDQYGNKTITHVPAEGLLFATQRTDAGSYVIWTQRNPLGITETGKAIYDPLGNYIPFRQMSDPRPPAGSYTSASMGGLSASQANPDAYAFGCLMDGIPTSCNRVLSAINNGQARTLVIDATQNPNALLANMGWFLVSTPTQQQAPTKPPKLNHYKPRSEPGKAPDHTTSNEIEWGIGLIAFDPDPQDPFKGARAQGSDPCAGVKPTDLIYDSDRVKYKDAKNALEHITNRHIRTDINQAASKYEFGYGLAGRSDANSIAGKQAAVINLNAATFAIAPAVPLPGGDLAFTTDFSFLSFHAPYVDVNFYVGYDNSKSGGDD
jgi:hypothetical protein